MRALEALANRVKSLTINELLILLSQNKEFTDLIIELNTRKQLFDKGIDSTGRTLESIGGGYSANTIEGTSKYLGKKDKGLPYDRITLYDSGEFYESFRVFYQSGNFVISADTIKDSTDLIREWGANILGLTDESLSLIRDKAKEIIIPYVRKKILTR